MRKLKQIFLKIDHAPLWLLAFPLTAAILLPCLVLGEGSVFVVHDQLDEYLMNYVLTARHLGESTIPEMLGGISASGLTPAAVLFLPLYRFLPAFTAFLICYAFVVLAAFLGMYLAVRELTGSSILGALFGGIFCLLGDYPVYGLSQAGIPLIFYAFLCLHCPDGTKGNKRRRQITALALTILFGLASHLVYTGYAVLGLWLVALLCSWLRCEKGQRKAVLGGEGLGFVCLLATYCITNFQLIGEILLGNADYVSHREEMVNGAQPFWSSVWDLFWNGQYHATTYHQYMIVPILVLLVLGGIFYRKLNAQARKSYRSAVLGMLLLFGIALFYGIWNSESVTAWKNSVSGFLHYFQADRVYWLYPAGWYLELAMLLGMWKKQSEATVKTTDSERKRDIPGKIRRLANSPCVCVLLSSLLLLPTAHTVLYQSNFYRNVNQYNNGSGITGYISWESYYAEELMQEIEDAIGRDMSTYRIAHLGISPAPSLMHGFYTVDGYSNNYPLSYKHAFREVIAAELDKAPETAVYFDTWGNRCYLFNSRTGTYWMTQKGSGIRYEGLEFDMDALAELGCEYLLSGGEIADVGDMGLELMGYLETENSYWGIWLYAVGDG